MGTPWKINMEPTNHPFKKENDLPNLHDYVPCQSSVVYIEAMTHLYTNHWSTNFRPIGQPSWLDKRRQGEERWNKRSLPVTRWRAPTIYKWSYNPNRWLKIHGYLGLFSPTSGVMGPLLITGVFCAHFAWLESFLAFFWWWKVNKSTSHKICQNGWESNYHDFRCLSCSTGRRYADILGCFLCGILFLRRTYNNSTPP